MERARGDVDVVAGPRVEIGYQIDSDGGGSRPGDLVAGHGDRLRHCTGVSDVNSDCSGSGVDQFVEHQGDVRVYGYAGGITSRGRRR